MIISLLWFTRRENFSRYRFFFPTERKNLGGLTFRKISSKSQFQADSCISFIRAVIKRDPVLGSLHDLLSKKATFDMERSAKLNRGFWGVTTWQERTWSPEPMGVAITEDGSNMRHCRTGGLRPVPLHRDAEERKCGQIQLLFPR